MRAPTVAYISELSPKTLAPTRLKNVSWFIMFYTLWCSYSQAAQPVFMEVIQYIVDHNMTVYAGKSDVSKHAELLKQFKIKSTPTCLFYRNGIRYEFEDEVSFENLKNFMNSILAAEVTRVNTTQQLSELRKAHPVIFLLVHDWEVDRDWHGTYTKVAMEKALRGKFCYTTEPGIVEDFGVSRPPAVVVIKDDKAYRFPGTELSLNPASTSSRLILNAFISEHLTHTTACTFSHLLSQIHNSQNADVEPLKFPSILFDTCESLNTSGHCMFLKNEENETKSWIIFKKEKILSTVHGLLNYLKLSNKTGVLALSQLEKALKNQDKDFSIDLAIRYMQQMIMCIEIDLEALKQIEGFQTTKEERYFFFPTLISEQQPEDTWKFSKECYLTGWCLTCTEPWHFFTPRFLQLLLIGLARQFALVPEPQCSRTLLELSSGCKLWKNGIRWLDGDGIETVVEVTEQSTNVVVMMRCLKGNEMSCIKHRSSVIQQILRIKDKLCSGITPKEYLLHPHCLTTYPMPMLSRIPMFHVAKSILHKKYSVPLDDEALSHTPGYPFLPVEELLFFEPCHCLGIKLLKEIFNPQCRDETAVPENIIQNLSKCMVEKWQYLTCILQVSPVEVEHDCESHDNIQKCRKALALWREESSSGTYGSLRRNLSHYSIFAGRNPLELYPELIPVAAAVEHDDMATGCTIDTNYSAQVDESVFADPRSAADIITADAVDKGMEIDSVLDQELDDSNHFEISNYLYPLVKQNMYSLGHVMGLDYTKLRHIMDSAPVTFNDDVIAAWLRREDNVVTRGAPSWRSLVAALRHPTVGQNGIADAIANDKGLR